jgi:hypothetical protein
MWVLSLRCRAADAAPSTGSERDRERGAGAGMPELVATGQGHRRCQANDAGHWAIRRDGMGRADEPERDRQSVAASTVALAVPLAVTLARCQTLP